MTGASTSASARGAPHPLFRVQNLPSWCDDAPSLVEGDIVDVDTRMGPAAAFDCDDGPVAGLTVHRVVIPPDRALYAEAPGASLALLPECPGDGLSCLASGTHQLVAAPRGPRATTAFLYTGRSSPSGAGRLTTLTTAFLAVPDHRRCDAAWQVDELPVLLRNQSLPLGEESLCGIGPAVFYDVPLEESQELTVTGARVAFAASCDPNSCLGSVNRRVYWTGRGAGRVVLGIATILTGHGVEGPARCAADCPALHSFRVYPVDEGPGEGTSTLSFAVGFGGRCTQAPGYFPGQLAAAGSFRAGWCPGAPVVPDLRYLRIPNEWLGRDLQLDYVTHTPAAERGGRVDLAAYLVRRPTPDG